MTRKKGEKRETGKKKNSLVCERRRMVYQTKKKEREREDVGKRSLPDLRKILRSVKPVR